jgi:hypothetical protein
MQKRVGYWNGQTLRAPVPPGRDPFINTPLLALGKGADGEERFWISSWNSVSGTTGVLVTESGQERIYHFAPPHSGFYSAASEDSDTLWLCGDLSRVVRLTLSSGAMEVYETGAPPALVFAGMIISHATGKLYAAAFPPSGPAAFSFDYKNRRPVQIYENICNERYMRAHFPNGDGTFSSVMHIPGLSLMQWNPQAETLEKVVLHEKVPGLTLPVDDHLKVDRLIGNAHGQWYFPEIGWYDPRARQFSFDGPRPKEEMIWFARCGSAAWGLGGEGGQKVVGKWNLETGEVEKVCPVADVHSSSAVLTANRKIVIVSIYGDFSRYDADTGALEISKRLPTDSVAHTDCLRRIDKNRLLGTPFITQRFWEVDLKTGRGFDCGRAAPGAGQITQTWKMGGKIYMAAYTGGELMEYDPNSHPHFPENPRVVATSPQAMRPVAATDDGRNLYYSSNYHYGRLGCIVTKYDTTTGLALYFDNPLPEQAIRSLCYDGSTHSLLAGTTMHADCNSASPLSSDCYLARFDAEDFSLLEQHAAPPGTGLAAVRGALGAGRYLCEVSGTFAGEAQTRWFALSLSDFKIPEIEKMKSYPEKMRRIIATEKPGLFVLFIGEEIQLWDMRRPEILAVLHSEGAGFYNGFVEGDSLLLAATAEVVVLENCLADY